MDLTDVILSAAKNLGRLGPYKAPKCESGPHPRFFVAPLLRMTYSIKTNSMTISYARQHGVGTIVTHALDANTSMLAVNEGLGFQRGVGEVRREMVLE